MWRAVLRNTALFWNYAEIANQSNIPRVLQEGKG